MFTIKNANGCFGWFEVNEIYHCEKIKKMPKKYMKK
jgi:hypothetical protein